MIDQDPTQIPISEARPKYRWLVFAGLALVVVGGLFFAARFAASLVGGDSWSVVAGQEVEVVIEPGTSANTIYVMLDNAGVARASQIRAAARSAGVEDQLQAGVYVFTTDMDPDEVVMQLVLGGAPIDAGSFVVIEGWTIGRILTELGDQTAFSRAEYERALTSGAVVSPMLPETSSTISDITRWEGLLFPATYEISGTSTPASVLQRMSDEMSNRLDTVDWSRIEELGISRYEGLIIASLIEREAGTDADRPLISSVIHNRLRDGMRLQIDATVVYALGGVDGRVSGEDLKVKSPYNTYRVDGLPPTPIGTVQIISVDAAVDPTDTNYYFYVLANEDGTHAFATTYEAHQANVQAAKDAGVLP